MVRLLRSELEGQGSSLEEKVRSGDRGVNTAQSKLPTEYTEDTESERLFNAECAKGAKKTKLKSLTTK